MTTSGDRWLSPSEQSSWLALAELMVKLPGALDSQLQHDAGLSHFEYMVLARLSEAPDRALRMGSLAALANGSMSRLSHVVKRLEERGWVRREPCPGDRRATYAVLTADGWAKVTATAPDHVDTVRSLVVDPLDAAQLEQLRALCSLILARLPAAGLGCPTTGSGAEHGQLAQKGDLLPHRDPTGSRGG